MLPSMLQSLLRGLLLRYGTKTTTALTRTCNGQAAHRGLHSATQAPSLLRQGLFTAAFGELLGSRGLLLQRELLKCGPSFSCGKAGSARHMYTGNQTVMEIFDRLDESLRSWSLLDCHCARNCTSKYARTHTHTCACARAF